MLSILAGELPQQHDHGYSLRLRCQNRLQDQIVREFRQHDLDSKLAGHQYLRPIRNRLEYRIHYRRTLLINRQLSQRTALLVPLIT